METVRAYIDGFNLYHAIDDLKQNHLKWVDLQKMISFFVDEHTQQLVKVHYFSAFATWLPESCGRHRQYIKALEARGVDVNMSTFFKKWRKCKHKWDAGGAAGQGDFTVKFLSHEEKQTDVKLALQLLNHARLEGSCDRIILVTGDSDIAPAVKMVRGYFPDKQFVLLAPPDRRHSQSLIEAAGPTKHLKKIKLSHLKRSLLPAEVKDATGEVVAIRPLEYAPPS